MSPRLRVSVSPRQFFPLLPCHLVGSFFSPSPCRLEAPAFGAPCRFFLHRLLLCRRTAPLLDLNITIIGGERLSALAVRALLVDHLEPRLLALVREQVLEPRQHAVHEGLAAGDPDAVLGVGAALVGVPYTGLGLSFWFARRLDQCFRKGFFSMVTSIRSGQAVFPSPLPRVSPSPRLRVRLYPPPIKLTTSRASPSLRAVSA